MAFLLNAATLVSHWPADTAYIIVGEVTSRHTLWGCFGLDGNNIVWEYRSLVNVKYKTKINANFIAKISNKVKSLFAANSVAFA